jgi:phosphoribosyl-ATP pyrophosphohydrolase/phosphoribosyl-AMP cyclohydrolase
MNADPNFDKSADGLLPAIVQHYLSGQVLMLGYLNRAAFAQTLAERRVTFYSRSKQRLWTKGESSGHFLELKAWHVDCDQDALLLLVEPVGPTCHNGTTTCFGEWEGPQLSFLARLEQLIEQRQQLRPEDSYTTKLFDKGLNKIAQKVGEEGVETALAGVLPDDEALIAESADLLFHLLVLLRARGVGLERVVGTLQSRHKG